jgi:hypothetical protein
MSESQDFKLDHQDEHQTDSKTELTVDPKQLDSAVLARLLDEVKADGENRLQAYNRTHNRHNRGR